MNLHKTRIDWCSHTWNPVTGCLHGCDYCYARKTALRFGLHPCEYPDPPISKGADCYTVNEPTKLYDEGGKYIRSTPYPAGFAPTLHTYTLDYPVKREIPSTVFVSSMGDLFGAWVADDWIEQVFNACYRAPWHTYLFLTKNPERYAELEENADLPTDSNFWWGATATNAEQMNRAAKSMGNLPALAKTFLSIEPLMEDITESPGWETAMLGATVPYFNWLIIGGLTGGRKDQKPKREWVEKIVDFAREHDIPVFMKENLIPTWGEDLIQEFPHDMPKPEEHKKLVPKCRECDMAVIARQGKRGESCTCGITGNHVPAAQARRSPSWCPRRKEGAEK